MTATLVKPESAITNAELQSTVARLADATRIYGFDISVEFNSRSTVDDVASGHSCSIHQIDSFEPEIDVVLAEMISLCEKHELAVHVEFKPLLDFGNKTLTRRAQVFSCWKSPCGTRPACFVSC